MPPTPDYVVTHPNADIRYHACDMILAIHTEASYHSEIGGKSRAVGHFYLTNHNDEDFNNQQWGHTHTFLHNKACHVISVRSGTCRSLLWMQADCPHSRHTRGNGTSPNGSSPTSPNSRHHRQHHCSGTHNGYNDAKSIQIKQPTVQLVKVLQRTASIQISLAKRYS